MVHRPIEEDDKRMITDILAAMVESQRLVQQAHGYDFKTMIPEDRMEYLRTMTLACTSELHEALDETGWKPWASSMHMNLEEWKGEMTDAWLFFMNLMLVGGMTAEDLISRTAKKQDNAYTRVKDGYDGVSTKCPICRRAYDNDGVKCRPGDGFDHPMPTCAYVTPLKPTSIITHSGVPYNVCPGCENPYDSNIAKNCFPQGQGFGWCAITARTIGLQIIDHNA